MNIARALYRACNTDSNNISAIASGNRGAWRAERRTSPSTAESPAAWRRVAAVCGNERHQSRTRGSAADADRNLSRSAHQSVAFLQDGVRPRGPHGCAIGASMAQSNANKRATSSALTRALRDAAAFDPSGLAPIAGLRARRWDRPPSSRRSALPRSAQPLPWWRRPEP